MNEQHPDTEPTSDEPIFWKDGKQFIRLYYFMPEKHLLDVIMNDEIKASIPHECNDPLEFLPADNDQLPVGRSMGGFISFSSHFSSSLMWSHYADSHRGVCIRFDIPILRNGKLDPSYDELNAPRLPEAQLLDTRYAILDIDEHEIGQFMLAHGNNDKKSAFIVEVDYRRERPVTSGIIMGTGTEGGEIVSLGISPTYNTKSEEWKYEKEWRIIVQLGETLNFDGKNFFIKGLTKHISGIILGTKFSKDRYLMRNYIQQAAKGHKYSPHVRMIELLQASYHPIEYKIIVK